MIMDWKLPTITKYYYFLQQPWNLVCKEGEGVVTPKKLFAYSLK